MFYLFSFILHFMVYCQVQGCDLANLDNNEISPIKVSPAHKAVSFACASQVNINVFPDELQTQIQQVNNSKIKYAKTLKAYHARVAHVRNMETSNGENLLKSLWMEGHIKRMERLNNYYNPDEHFDWIDSFAFGPSFFITKARSWGDFIFGSMFGLPASCLCCLISPITCMEYPGCEMGCFSGIVMGKFASKCLMTSIGALASGPLLIFTTPYFYVTRICGKLTDFMTSNLLAQELITAGTMLMELKEPTSDQQLKIHEFLQSIMSDIEMLKGKNAHIPQESSQFLQRAHTFIQQDSSEVIV